MKKHKIQLTQRELDLVLWGLYYHIQWCKAKGNEKLANELTELKTKLGNLPRIGQ